jgi:hypothetical protein
MKILAAFCLLLSAVGLCGCERLPILAPEVKFTSAAWNDLSIPLGITPFYLEIDSPVKARKVSVEMDLYAKGVFKRTLSTMTIGFQEEKRLDLKSAIYFQPQADGTIKGTCVIHPAAGGRGISYFNLSQSELPLAEGASTYSVGETKISEAKRIPVFVILAGAPRGVSMADNPEDAPKANPDAFVIVGYLKKE